MGKEQQRDKARRGRSRISLVAHREEWAVQCEALGEIGNVDDETEVQSCTAARL